MSSRVSGCRECDWPYASAAPQRAVRIHVESNADRDGKQGYTIDWIEPKYGRVRGMVGRGVVEHSRLWGRQDTAPVIVYAAGVRPAPAAQGGPT